MGWTLDVTARFVNLTVLRAMLPTQSIHFGKSMYSVNLGSHRNYTRVCTRICAHGLSATERLAKLVSDIVLKEYDVVRECFFFQKMQKLRALKASVVMLLSAKVNTRGRFGTAAARESSPAHFMIRLPHHCKPLWAHS